MNRILLALALAFVSTIASAAEPLKLLFLGDKGHHQPALRFRQLQPVMAKVGIDVTYTEEMSALSEKTLARYDGLIVYANIDNIAPEQAKALLDYVAGGKGFIPLHCASYCFRNSPEVVALIGAQFLRHNTGTFRTQIAEPEHPIMKGFKGFESWDETYVHTKHNEKDRTVLEYRDEGNSKEPWTWVRTHGKGRVFYTAWGHDERTWGNPGFQNLIERGIRWACGQDPTTVAPFADRPTMTTLRKDVKPFEYVDAKVPFYPPSRTWGVTAEPLNKMQKPLPAEESIKHFVHPVDFEVKLFVDETKLGGGKPICMNWDERGRLWVALTFDYPNEKKPEGQGRDKILICEDTDGDGVCDKVTEFADKLSIPTSILPYAGGVIVLQAPHTLFLKATKGDDKCDLRQVLFTGWGTQDTHAGPSNLRYGLDNWIYGIVGYSGYVGTVADERHRFSQGFFRFKIEASPKRERGESELKVAKLEFLRSTSNNSWGVGFSEEGHLFGSTANGCPSVFMPIPNRYYEKVRGLSPTVLRNIAPDNHFEPITTKVRQVDWHGGFTAAAGSAIYTARTYPREYWNRIQFVCEPTGHLVAMFELTPNGADFKARYFGNLLASDDEWSAPIMAEVGPDGNVWVIDWYNYIVQHNPTPPGYRTGRGNAYETDLRDKKYGRIYRVVAKKAEPEKPVTLAGASPEQLRDALRSSNMFWRLTAQRLRMEGGAHVSYEFPLNPESERVRSLLGYSESRPNRGIASYFADLLAKPEFPTDPIVRDAMTIALAAHDSQVLIAVAQQGKVLPASNLSILFAVSEHYARGKDQSPGSLISVLGQADRPVLETILAALAKGWSRTNKQTLSDEAEASLAKLLESASPKARADLLKFATAIGSKTFEKQAAEIAKSMLAQALDEKQSDDDRVSAIRQVIGIGVTDSETINSLLTAVTPQSSPQFTSGVIDALGSSDSSAVAPALVKRYSSLPPSGRAAVVRALLGRVESTRTLLDALDKGQIPLGDLALDQRQALATHLDRRIAAQARGILSRGGGLPDADRQKVIDQFLPVIKKAGDAEAGKLVFKNNCAKCHRHSGEGEQIGPDLTGVAVHTKEHLLVDILDPSRNVEGNFRIYRVEMKDGRALQGLLASETRTTIEIIDAEAKRHVVQRSEVEELQASNKSLMPEGFEKTVKPEEIANLLEFLTKRGKFLPIPLDKAATIVSSKGMFFSEDANVERLIFRDWTPKTFEGVPFYLIEPKNDKVMNAIMLYGPQGKFPPTMPKAVKLPCNAPAKAIHFLSGVSGWGFPYSEKGSVTMIVRLHYADGKDEDHELKNGEQFADYIRRVDVPGSKFAFALRGQQIRYFAVTPKRESAITEIELVKGPDNTAPVVMAVTVETR
jgi:uncharacterized protein